MAFNHSYSETQLQAAKLLMELISPKSEQLNQLFLSFEQELGRKDYEFLPIYEVIYEATEGKDAFKARIENPQELLEKVQKLAWHWGAFVHFERHNWASMYKEFEKSALLLSNIAQELKSYGLGLWTWETEHNFVSGFISKIEDSELIKKLSINCGYPLKEI